MNDYEHGRTVGYVKGCRCEKCVDNHRRRCKSYNVRKHAHGGSTTVDAARAAVVLAEMAERMTLSEIGRALGTSHGWVSKVIRGDIKRINPDRERTVLRVGNHRPGGRTAVPALGTKRRLQALHAMGYTWVALAAETGYSVGGLKSVTRGEWDVVEARNAEAVRDAYERLSMVLPTSDDPHQRSAINSARNKSRRYGWPPPLAWNNPDDPAERPDAWHYKPATRLESFAELAERGAGVSEMCRRLELTRAALQKWCSNNGLSAEFRAACGREHNYSTSANGGAA